MMKLLLSVLVSALLTLSGPVVSMSNAEFANAVQQHIEVLKSGKKINETVALCRNLSDARREQEPKCVAYTRYKWEMTTGPNKARIRIR